MSQLEKAIRRDTCDGNRGRLRGSDYSDFCSSVFETVFKVKLVLVGDSGAGKTCLATRFVKGSFTTEDMASLGAAFLHKEVKMKDHTILFQIWDTAGQERYRSLVPMYLRGAKSALLVYDASNLDSFIIASEWLKQLHLHCPDDLKIVLVAAKCDLPSAVPTTTAQAFAAKNQLLFMETSSKTGFNVEKVFTTLGVHHICQHSGTPASVFNKMNQHESSLGTDILFENGDITGESKGPNFDSSSFKNIYNVKLVLVGDSGVGKTCLVTRFVEGTFKSERTTSLAGKYTFRITDLGDTNTSDATDRELPVVYKHFSARQIADSYIR
ncbi:hypothetical protein CHS0354_001707 [Potamilus streckersoni]|uniref:Uncharacterized protein n=1 Tax=Potamilus streckersoni TaxID=2493646 RepID=A0AAE0RZS0_9BIVA|nr:hypothetical protein CHS0354_001707 [Potamilus streckersoni]